MEEMSGVVTHASNPSTGERAIGSSLGNYQSVSPVEWVNSGKKVRDIVSKNKVSRTS